MPPLQLPPLYAIARSCHYFAELLPLSLRQLIFTDGAFAISLSTLAAASFPPLSLISSHFR